MEGDLNKALYSRLSHQFHHLVLEWLKLLSAFSLGTQL